MFEKKENGLLIRPESELRKLQAQDKLRELKKNKKKATTVAELAERVELLERMLGVD